MEYFDILLESQEELGNSGSSLNCSCNRLPARQNVASTHFCSKTPYARNSIRHGILPHLGT
jgi:hypothetical protein